MNGRLMRFLRQEDNAPSPLSSSNVPSDVMTTITRQLRNRKISEAQLKAMSVCGWLSLLLYSMLFAAAAWMVYLHVTRGSSMRKKAFHSILLLSVAFCFPDALSYIAWPKTEHWIAIYPFHVWVILLQSMCKSYLAVCWSEVVSAGQSRGRRHAVTTVIKVTTGLLIVYAIALPLLLMQFKDTSRGQFLFMRSELVVAIVYIEVIIVTGYGTLLLYQGMRLRRRLLLAKGTMPAASVEKSLYQLMLTVFIILFADTLRIVSLLMSQSNVKMSITMYLVVNNLIPTIFPTICMLYLMRRITKPKNKHANVRQHHVDVTLSRYMTDDSNSDTSDSNESFPGVSNFVLPKTHVKSARRAHGSDPNDVDTSPAFCWIRK